MFLVFQMDREQPDSDVHKRHKPHMEVDVMKDIDSVLSNVQSARQKDFLDCFGRSWKQWSRRSVKERSPTMRTRFPEPTEFALDWLFDRIDVDSKNQNQIHWHPKTNSSIWTKGNFTRVMSGIICCVCFYTDHFSSAVLQWYNGKKISTRFRRRAKSQQNQDLWWIWQRGYLRSCRLQLHWSWGRHGTDIKILGNLLWKTIDQGNQRVSPLQVILQMDLWSFLVFSRVKSETTTHDRSGKPDETSWTAMQQVCPST